MPARARAGQDPTRRNEAEVLQHVLEAPAPQGRVPLGCCGTVCNSPPGVRDAAFFRLGVRVTISCPPDEVGQFLRVEVSHGCDACVPTVPEFAPIPAGLCPAVWSPLQSARGVSPPPRPPPFRAGHRVRRRSVFQSPQLRGEWPTSDRRRLGLLRAVRAPAWSRAIQIQAAEHARRNSPPCARRYISLPRPPR